MKRQINISHFKNEARKAGVSVYLLIKRELNYRKTRDIRNCLNCKYGNPAEYKDRECFQCQWICESNDLFADVDEKHVCNYHKILVKGEENEPNI